MKNTLTLDMQSVQGTMLLPLWGRAEYSKKNPEILDDQKAIEIVENLDFDFSEIGRNFGEFGGLCYIIRARKIEDKIRDFIKIHPKATIVNIGSGLDTSFSRIDNEKIHWYNLDMPDAIEFRQSLIPDSERNSCIAKSFFDQSWFDDIVYNKEDGILFVSGGVLYYFKDEELQEIFAAMAKRFPGAEVYFDAETKRAIAFSNRMVKKTGNKGAMMYFYVNDGKKIKNWSPNIQEVECIRYFKDVKSKKSWLFQSRMQMFMLDKMRMMKFVHVKFKSE
ncbi:hypothetical protein MmiHf6_00810 [Methanimicrococcus hongohii]|uniref:Polyketide biosynthesis methyltransferase n=1 Tax=Methanimicrococcus hongohii TaxID=3028295 RepID=A0AA96UY70_9EURY|nr:class I SAM-dependent methyltransferase [Methanimicrococcus sp. Hf6]WNY22796.1 hypothetical protein MmiHf6_00810 [Methanimicrococcus sp. Hf6]